MSVYRVTCGGLHLPSTAQQLAANIREIGHCLRCGHRQLFPCGWTTYQPTSVIDSGITCSARMKRKKDFDADLESTAALIDESDINALLDNEQALANLRAQLLSDMARVHGAAQPGQPSNADSSNGRPFDSDDYEYTDTEFDQNSQLPDAAAEAAARSLAAQSRKIAAEHVSIDSAPAGPSRLRPEGRQSDRQSKQQGSSPKKQSPNGQQANKQRSKEPRGSTRGKGGNGRGGAGVFTSEIRLTGDTVIGRVAEGLPGVAVAVLQHNKDKVFEHGAPMVRACNCLFLLFMRMTVAISICE